MNVMCLWWKVAVRKIGKISNFLRCNHPLQMHALNAAHVNYPIHLSVFNRIDVVHVFEIRDVVTWAQRASRRTKHVI